MENTEDKLFDLIEMAKTEATARLVAPGDPANSILFSRVARAGPGQMPPMGSTSPDPRAVSLLLEWITKVKAPEPKVEEPKVEEPQIPVTPAVTSAKSLKASTVKTGDVANITGIILILILSCTVIVLCGTMNAWRKAKKHHKKH